MHGIWPHAILAEIGIPTAWQCLTVAGPALAVAGGWWLINRLDLIIDRVFPHLEWERKLGWLNIRAQQRADAFFRWLGYFVYAVLALALFGLVWSVRGLAAIRDWNDPSAVAEVPHYLPILLLSCGFWMVYLGCALIPKIRNQHEEEELEKFRAEQEELDREYREVRRSRGKGRAYKPRYETPSRRDRGFPGG